MGAAVAGFGSLYDFTRLNLSPTQLGLRIYLQYDLTSEQLGGPGSFNLGGFEVEPSTNFKLINGEMILSDAKKLDAEAVAFVKNGSFSAWINNGDGTYRTLFSGVKAEVSNPIKSLGTVGDLVPVVPTYLQENEGVGTLTLHFPDLIPLKKIILQALDKTVYVLVDGKQAQSTSGNPLSFQLDKSILKTRAVRFADFYLSGVGIFELALAIKIGNEFVQISTSSTLAVESPLMDSHPYFAVACPDGLPESACQVRVPDVNNGLGGLTINQCEKIYGPYGDCFLSSLAPGYTTYTTYAENLKYLLSFKNYSVVPEANDVKIQDIGYKARNH